MRTLAWLVAALVILGMGIVPVPVDAVEASDGTTGDHTTSLTAPISYPSDLENFSLTAKFLTTLQISGGAKDGGIEEAEDNPYDNTDNTLESIWVWTRYEALTGDRQYRPNIWKAWNYSLNFPSWQETDSGKIYSCGWSVIAWAEYRKVIGPNAQYENYAKQAAQFIDTNNGWEPDTLWNANERNLIRGWASGALYTYAKVTGDATARSTALRIGNDTKASLTTTPSLASIEAWALSGGAMLYGVANSVLLEFPDDAWLRTNAMRLDRYVPVSGSGAGRSQNGWEAWYALGFDATWRILKDDYFYEHARNITNNLILRDTERDGGLPTNIGDPTNTDESWVTNYRAYFGLRPMMESSQNATLTGVVKDAVWGKSIAGAQVNISDNISSYSSFATTNATGAYTLTVPPQIYQVQAGAAGFQWSAKFNVVIPPGSSKTLHISLKGIVGGNDTTPPVITHTPPGSVVEGTAIPISMTVTDNMVVSSVTVYYRQQGAGSWKSGAAAKGGGNDYSFTIPSADVKPPAIEYYIEAADTSANKATSPAGAPGAFHSVTVTPKGGGNDTSPPTIVHTPVTSATDGTDLALSAKVTDNVGVAQVELHYQWKGGAWMLVMASKQSGDSWTATIPGADLKVPSVEYYLTASDAAQNSAALPPQGAGAPWSIKVTPRGGAVPPKVFGTKPQDGATAVPLNTLIEVSFTAEMDSVATKAAFSISPSEAGKSSGFDPVLVFDPDADLAPGTTYTVTISTAARDLNGTALPTAYSFSFRTVEKPGDPGGASNMNMFTAYVIPGIIIVAVIIAILAALWLLAKRRRRPHPRTQEYAPQPWQQAQQWQYQRPQQDPYSQQPPWNQP